MPDLSFDDLIPAKAGLTPGGVPIGPDGIPRVVVGNSASDNKPAQPLDFSDLIPNRGSDKDLPPAAAAIQGGARAIVSGLSKGAAGLAGLPADILAGGVEAQNTLQSKASGRPYEEVQAENDKSAAIPRSVIDDLQAKYGSDALQNTFGYQYDPQNKTEKFLKAGAEFVPSAMLGPGNMARNVVTMGVLPGVAQEAAGEATQGTKLEGPARAAAAILAGGVGAWAMGRNSAGKAISQATHGVTDQQLDAAEQLFQHAQQIGTPITRAEALQHVTAGATNLGNLQRVVEGSGEMRPFFSQRPGQVDAAARQQFDQLGPAAAQPSNIGPQIGQAAEGVRDDVQGAINRHTRPLYQAAEPQRVGPQIHNALMGDPLYAQTLHEVRNNPALNRTIAHLPDDAVGTVDLVQRRMREASENAAVPGQASTSNLVSANYQDARTAPLAAADTVTGSRPGIAGTYETARNTQAQLRQQYLEPLMNGPIGKLAARDTTTQKAISVLFPTQPLANSEHEIGQAVTALAARSPMAARQLVRAHVESVFNEATQRLQSGANEFGGAGFAAVLRGNPQQAANLEAAVTALRGGQAYHGFDNFLQVLEAMGSRQRIGSQTAFNQEMQAALRQGGKVGEVVKVAATGGFKFPQKAMDAVERWRLGSNVGQIADVLTNPDAAVAFRELARTAPTSTKAAALSTRLIYLAERSREHAK